MKIYLIRKFPIIQQIFLGERGKNIFLFVGVLLPNIAAAMLEGLSFALILIALNILNDVRDQTFIAKILEPFLPLDKPQRSFILCIGFAILAQVCRSAFSYVGQIISVFLATRMQLEGQRQVYNQIFRFSFSCVNKYKNGELLEYSRMPSLIIPPLMTHVSQMLISFFTIVCSVGMMFFISIKLTLLAIVVFGLLVLSQKFIIRKISKISHFLTNHMIDFSRYTIQSLHALRIIHTFQRQKHVLNTIQVILDQVAATTRKLNLWSQSVAPLNETLGVIIVGAFLTTGELLLADRATAILPTLLTFTIIIHRLNSRLQLFLGSVGGIASSWGQMIKLEEILDEKDKEFISIGHIQNVNFEQSIVFHNVSLQYPATKTPAVKHLNLTIPKGITTAFVGTSGAGKSSILDLLLGLYDPTEGRICIDEVDLKHIDLGVWRSKLGVVNQDTFVFNASIEENIKFGTLDASFQDVEKAAEMAGAHQFISILPDGYHTIVGERGYRLSGGERQRIALARALIRDPEILILDEATSSLDTESERLIQQALNQLSKEKTIIIVAHRLSTIAHADQIIVIDGGKTSEIGTHQKLLDKKGRYFRFWNAQVKASHRQEEKILLTTNR